jgi:hypothetical protein
VDKLITFTDTVISCSVSLPATSVATMVTVTVYDAQVTNLNGGTVDEGISYRIKGTNADKFSITTDTGILTYKDNATNIY